MTLLRGALLVVGGALAAYGVFLAVTTLSPAQLLALAIWLAAVVVVHDAVLAPTASWLHARWYRRAESRPRALTAVAHVGFVVGAVLTLFVIPELWAQGRGNPNPTILVGDYALRLVIVWALIAATVLVVGRIVIRRSRR
ncbi:hypothetical protein ACEYYH_02890 [Microbacterium trichothecenolyticum]|uniref:hypothetical protein n=1 Tax=Microbacterium trichothecenolyticum TaxID=69370 RepID=UPI0035BE2000